MALWNFTQVGCKSTTLTFTPRKLFLKKFEAPKYRECFDRTWNKSHSLNVKASPITSKKHFFNNVKQKKLKKVGFRVAIWWRPEVTADIILVYGISTAANTTYNRWKFDSILKLWISKNIKAVLSQDQKWRQNLNR